MSYNKVIRKKKFCTNIKANLRPDKSGLSLTGFNSHLSVTFAIAP
jgi:hypothetical protein